MKILTRSAVSVTGPYDVHPHLAQDRKPPQHPMTLHFLQAGCYSQCPTSSVKVLQTILMPTNTDTHTFNGPFSRQTWVSQYQKRKTYLDFTEARDSEWQLHQLGRMQMCTLLQTDNHATTPPLSFYRPSALSAAQPTASMH